MTLEEINVLEIEDVSEVLGQRLAVKELPVTSENLNTEFLLYKQELLDTELERLRVQDLKDRWETLKDRDAGVPSFRKLKPEVPNAQKYIMDLIKDKEREDEASAFFTALETEELSFIIDNTKTGLYLKMVEDVYTAMELVFGTRNDMSASAFAATWEAMVKRPANYVDAALGFTDEASVLAYANAKITLADAYAVQRLKIIGKFQQDVLGI